VEERESREREFDGVQRSSTELNKLSVRDSHGKLVVEEELEVSL
jgi:hypothetical protein